MRWIVFLFTILLSGCHGIPLFEQPATEAPSPIMPLWEHYQKCLIATDSTELALVIEQFDHIVVVEAEPPSWMRAWGNNVTNQPLRTAVDPRALGAACTLRAAASMLEAGHPTEAQALYRRMLARYASPAWAYYVDQARAALAGLHEAAPAVVALRSDRAVPH